MRFTVTPDSEYVAYLRLELTEEEKEKISRASAWQHQLYWYPNWRYRTQLQDYDEEREAHERDRNHPYFTVRWFIAKKPTLKEPQPNITVTVADAATEQGCKIEFDNPGDIDKLHHLLSTETLPQLQRLLQKISDPDRLKPRSYEI
jgi:hypothetical protein